MNRLTSLFAACLILTVTACTPSGKPAGKNGEDSTHADSSAAASGINGLSLEKLTGSPAFDDAEVSILSPDITKPLKPGKTTFQFGVKNFELGKETPGWDKMGIATSKMGQHLHVIVDNEPYMAHYDAKVELDLTEGYHTIVVFPSRNYHESVKGPKAGIVKRIKVGNPREKDDFDMKAPMLVYSRPKGTYKGYDETHLVLLDFYLFNCTLSPDGYKVKAEINTREFMITEWQPSLIKGLATGDNIIRLALVDKEGKAVEGPWNSVSRTIQCEEKKEN